MIPGGFDGEILKLVLCILKVKYEYGFSHVTCCVDPPM